MKMTLGNVLECLPDFMLRRLAKADGAWSWKHYCGTKRCLVGHAANLVNWMGGTPNEAALLQALSGPDEFALGYIGGRVEAYYLELAERFGDARIGRAIEARANKILADRAVEADLASVEVEGDCIRTEISG